MQRVYARKVFERFTERARQVVVLAQDEARLLGHAYIGEEHLLLGLLREEDGVAARWLRESGLEIESMRERVRAAVGEEAEPTSAQIPFTPRAKEALERGLRESLSLGQNFIGTEHILLGILRDPGAVLAQILEDAALDIGAVMSRVMSSAPGTARLEVLPATHDTRFTEPARQVVVYAQHEARALTHNYVGTEHILLGLLREEEGLAARVLDALHITLEEVRAQVARIVGVGDEVLTGEIPFTPRAKKVLELALREALSLGHNHIGPEHILLGVARTTEGVGARVLLQFDADAERIQMEVVRALSGPGGRSPRPPREPPPRVVVPCPACGQKLSYLEINAGSGGSFKADRRGTTACPSCGRSYDLRYSIEWRPA
jgi:ATP-dependent Clp protease ATP-binding subunit ClpA